MGVFNRLFSSEVQDEPQVIPQSFMDCITIIRLWSANPDIDVSDPGLQAAMNTYVTCPECDASYYFSEAMRLTGTSITVKCPRCNTDPSQADYDESYDGAWT